MSYSEETKLTQLFEENHYKYILEKLPALTCVIELDATKQIVFKYLSPNCIHVLGIDAFDLLEEPKKFAAKIYADDEVFLMKQIKASVKTGKPINWEGRVWVDDWQEYKWINLRASPNFTPEKLFQWYGIIINFTESVLQKEELVSSKKSLIKFSLQLHNAKDEERKRISREVHDDIGGNLSAIKLGLNRLLVRLNPKEVKLVEKIEYILSIVNQTFESVHKIASDLRPNLLELGLVAAFSWQIDDFKKRSSIKAGFQCNVDYLKLAPDQELALFRICQEALSNIIKYSEATEVKVSLNVEIDRVFFHIEDNGKGFKFADVDNLRGQLGLIGMKERVAELNGVFEISSYPNIGTVIKVTIPKQLFDKV